MTMPWTIRLGMLAGLAVVWAGCSGGGSDPRRASFQGEWTLTEESEVSGAKTVKSMQVIADGDRFRLESKVREDRGYAIGTGGDHLETLVYDGSRLYSKVTYPALPGRDPLEPSIHTRQPTEAELKELRFWTRQYPGKPSAGGLVAGRDTRLISADSKERHQHLTLQTWVDAATGVVLKSQLALYSPQAGATVRRVAHECLSIRYGPAPAGAFAPLQ